MTIEENIEQSREALHKMRGIPAPYITQENERGIVILDLTDANQKKMYDVMRNYVNNHRLNNGVSLV